MTNLVPPVQALPKGSAWRKIDGAWLICRDVGCFDFAKAKANRERIAQEVVDDWQQFYEELDRLAISLANTESWYGHQPRKRKAKEVKP